MAVPEEGLGTTARFLAKNRLNNNVQSWIESCPFQIRRFRFTFNLIQQEKRLQDRSPYMKIKECPAKARLIFIAKRIHGYQASSTRLMKTKSYESNDISELERWQSFQHSAHLLWSIAVHLSIIRKPLGSKRAMPYYIYSDDTWTSTGRTEPCNTCRCYDEGTTVDPFRRDPLWATWDISASGGCVGWIGFLK